MRWTVAALLRPITFALAIVAGVTVGNRTDTFWLGFLAFFIAMGAGRVLGALIRKRLDKAVYKAIWPGAATGPMRARCAYAASQSSKLGSRGTRSYSCCARSSASARVSPIRQPVMVE